MIPATLKLRTKAVLQDLNVIETGRLNLREMSERDAAFVLELLNDPDFKRNIADRGVRTLEDARAYVSERFAGSYRRHGFGLWLVETKEGRAPAGICGLVKRDTLPGIDIGYAFLPSFRGKGYAYESASAVMRHAREVLGLGRLYAIVNPDNAGSIRVLEKLGMRFERMLRLSAEGPEIKLFSADL
jgi:ribosomal-protein-alanine N-acetyltransferase